MKRPLFPLLITLLISTTAFSQIRVGILGGGHRSDIIEKNNIPNWNDLKQRFSPRTAAHFGFSADIPMADKSNFYFQPGVIYYGKGRNSEYGQDSTVVFVRPPRPDSIVSTYYLANQQQHFNYLEIPLHFVYKMKLGKNVKFMIGAGPYFSFFYNGYDRTENIVVGVSYNEDNKDDLPVGKGAGKYTTVDVGASALAGFEFGRVFLTANYTRGLTNFYTPSDYEATDYKHQVMGVTLGVYLGKVGQKPVKSKPKDTDKDGVPDNEDKCPTIAGLPALHGCPDQDGDGIADSDDRCPHEWGPADNYGCPIFDRDGDGVLDRNDRCPDLAGPRENNGCPFEDTDKDGVLDKDDKCPTVPGLLRYDGCPIPDSDGDGINDEEDRCRDEKGLPELNGCPEVKQELVEQVQYAAKKIQFKVNKAELTTESFGVLDEVATLLQSDSTLRLSISGHTSQDGPYELNKRLSHDRANAVKNYLEKKGIDGTRLTAEGFGPDRPLNEGKSETERAKNRRVELELSR